jgi:NAD-dependent dihydropyrimidine dehydrogenase PreA subunit
MNIKINSMFFSPTGTTKKTVSSLTNELFKLFNNKSQINTIDFTLPGERKNARFFKKNDLLVIGVPVYAGRVPNILLDYLNLLKGENTFAVAVVMYGNRNYDDALIELNDILESNGFDVIAAAAFIGQHSFSDTLGANRPDKSDMELVNKLANQIFNKLITFDRNKINIKGNRPYRPYYIVKDENNKPLYDFRKITPKTDDNCIDCKLCAELCPMGSIDFDDVSKMNGICIKCCSCIKNCPVGSKYFDAPDFLNHKEELEINFDKRKEPEIFL